MNYNGRQVNVYEGLVVKNYKEMCKLLNEDITGGNSKKAQVNNWKRYFDFQKDGQKFIITEIYSEPIPMSRAKETRDGLYIRNIEYLLIDLINKSQGSLSISKNCLFNKLGFTNNKYAQFYRTVHDTKFVVGSDDREDDKEDSGLKREDFIEKVIKSINQKGTLITAEDCFKENCIKTYRGNTVPIQYGDIISFYQTANSKLSKILNRAIRSMEKHNLISFYQGYEVAIRTGKKNKQGKERVKIRPASDLECLIISEIKKQAIIETGCINEFDVGCKHQWRKYQKVIDELTTKHFPDWAFFYPVYVFIGLSKSDTITHTKPITQQRIELNKKVVATLETMYDTKLKNSRQRYEEARENYIDEWGQVIKEKLPYRLPSYYPVQQKLIMDELIKINTNNESEDLST